MTETLVLRVIERVHGHLGWLAVAALAHPVVLLRDPTRRARLAVGLTTGLVALTAALGAGVYPHYRELLKQRIFLEAPALGWTFERKEHLAVGAVTFALVGCLAHFAAPLFPANAGAGAGAGARCPRETVARLAHGAFVAAFALALVVAALGLAVASYKSF